MAITKTIRVEFEGMTWKELRHFVDAAEDAGIGDDDPVDLWFAEDDPVSPLGLELVLVSKP